MKNMIKKELKQVIKEDVVNYVDSDGWEDPISIDISFKSNWTVRKDHITYKNNGNTVLTSSKFFNTLINRYIGRREFFKSHKDTRKILLDYALKEFETHLIRKWGSLHNYQKARIKRKWNMSYCAYRDMCAVSNGYKNKSHQQLERMKKKGLVKDFTSLNNYYARKRGFKNAWEYQKSLQKSK